MRVERRRASLEGSLDALEMPANFQAVIRTRLDRPALDVRQVLRAAAVVGRDFTREILLSVLANSERVGLALDALTAAGIVRQTAVLPDHATGSRMRSCRKRRMPVSSIMWSST